MDSHVSCGMKNILRRLFRKKLTNKHETEADDSNTRPATRITSISRGSFEFSRRYIPPHLSYLARENSLAPYLHNTRAQLVTMNHTSVLVMSREQLRKWLRENPRVLSGPEYDPFMEASASCPIAEESFDSGLLKTTTPWFM